MVILLSRFDLGIPPRYFDGISIATKGPPKAHRRGTMTIRAYLEVNPPTTKKAVPNGRHIISETLVFGHLLQGGETTPFIVLDDEALQIDVAEHTQSAIKCFTLCDHISFGSGMGHSARMAGEYRQGNCTAEVRLSSCEVYRVMVRGKTIAEVRDLYNKIRMGEIAPTETFDRIQVKRTVIPLKLACRYFVGALANFFVARGKMMNGWAKR